MNDTVQPRGTDTGKGHALSIGNRREITVSGGSEVVSFDDTAIVLKTNLGDLIVQGDGLILKGLSLEGGQVSVSGHISSLVYEEPRPVSRLRRLFG